MDVSSLRARVLERLDNGDDTPPQLRSGCVVIDKDLLLNAVHVLNAAGKLAAVVEIERRPHLIGEGGERIRREIQ